jgi:hypothetical protein
MQVSLKKHLSEISLPIPQDDPHLTYPQYHDFQSSGKYYGECPLKFSFEPSSQTHKGWVELMDGHLFLVPFLFSQKITKPQMILPRLSLKMLPANLDGFHYSVFSYGARTAPVPDVLYLFMEYYENLTHETILKRSFDQVALLCSQNAKVKLVLNCYLSANGKDPNLTQLLEGIRKLPSHCSLLSLNDYNSILNLQGSETIFLYDEDVLTHSVWEEITIIKNGTVIKDKISPLDTLVHSFCILPKVKREIYFHRPLSRVLSLDKEEELKKIVRSLSTPEELLHQSYRRLISDIVNS